MMKTKEPEYKVFGVPKKPAIRMTMGTEEELKTEPPISEKDEVKKAESKMREKAKKK